MFADGNEDSVTRRLASVLSFAGYTKHSKIGNTYICFWKYAWVVNYGPYFETGKHYYFYHVYFYSSILQYVD